MSCKYTKRDATIIVGGGLAGLTAGYILSSAGRDIALLEGSPVAGGLSRTVWEGGFRFDVGGHRFFTRNQKIDELVRSLLHDELLLVHRKSKIYLHHKYFDYPIRPVNALTGFGLLTSLRIILDYGMEKLKSIRGSRENISLEDWVISNFGHKMFDIYFKEYSEKVWGIECSRISAEWVAQRIKGLSLMKAVKNAFFKFSGKDIATLADRFLYPSLGIGRISEKLVEEITAKGGRVITNTRAVRINHGDFVIEDVIAQNCSSSYDIRGDDFISTIPITSLLQMMHPSPPDEVIDAASMLRYRDIVVVAVMLDRDRVTDQTWIYIPEKKIPFGRIHEPKNWSPMMAPPNKTLLVAEYFCFEGDEVWSAEDKELINNTVQGLEDLGFIRQKEVINSVIIKASKAYPLFEVGYRKHYDMVIGYLKRFKNLHLAGRSGMFRYYNMDHAMESGINAAEGILQNLSFSYMDVREDLPL